MEILITIIAIAIMIIILFKITKKILKWVLFILTFVFFYPELEKVGGLIENNIKTNYTYDYSKKIVFLGDSLTTGQNNNTTFLENSKNVGYANQIKDKYKAANAENNVSNFAVSGYTSNNVLSDIQNNVEYQTILEKNRDVPAGQNTPNFEQAMFQNPIDTKIQDQIKNANYIIMTVGNNDILKILDQDDKSLPTLVNGIDQTVESKQKIINEIRKYNQNAKIMFIGSYVPYKNIPYYNKVILYDLLIYMNNKEQRLQDNNFAVIPIRQNINVNLNEFIPQNDIHLNEKGYNVVLNKLEKYFDKN